MTYTDGYWKMPPEAAQLLRQHAAPEEPWPDDDWYHDDAEYGPPPDDTPSVEEQIAQLDIAQSRLVDTDIATILAGDLTPEQPTIQAVGDRHLIYAARANVIYGESGIGKTWLTYSIATNHINNGGSIIVLDWEDTPHNLVRRLLALGCPPDTIADRQRIRHITVTTPLGTPELAHAHSIANQLDGHTLIIFDAAADALAVDGIDENDNTRVTAWWHRVISPILRAGHTALLVDHQTTKQPGEDKGRGARGASAKLALTDGAAYEAKVITGFSQDQPGELKLVIAKDRHGAVGPIKTVIAHIHATPNAGRLHLAWTLADVDTTGRERPTVLIGRICDWLANTPDGATTRQILEAVEGKDKYVRYALTVLIQEGTVTISQGPRNSTIHKLSTPPKRPRPTAAPPRPGHGQTTAAPDPLPEGSGPRSDTPANTPLRPTNGAAVNRATCTDCGHTLERGGWCPWCHPPDTHTDEWIAP